MDKSNPRKYLEDKERKPKPKRPPRGAIVKKKSGDYKVYLDTHGQKVYIGCYKERDHAVKAYWDSVRNT